MEKYYLILIITIAIVFSVLMISWVFPLKISSSPEECKIILENEGENKVDVVFLTDNVQEDSAKEYADFLLNSEPFSLNREKFNFFYAGQTDCEIKEGLLFCYSRDLVKKASACKNDFVIVLSEQSGEIRSSSYIDVLSINVNHPHSVLLHEFAHAFASLADEYVPSVLPRGAKNCQEKCEKFEIMDGCFQGCAKADLSRSSESSVMRTLRTSEYKKLNTVLIERSLDKYE